MENIELEKGNIEGHFGLILRDKYDHNNYISIKFEDLEKIIQYYEEFKNAGIFSIKPNDKYQNEKNSKIKQLKEVEKIIMQEIVEVEKQQEYLEKEFGLKGSKEDNTTQEKFKMEIESLLNQLREVRKDIDDLS